MAIIIEFVRPIIVGLLLVIASANGDEIRQCPSYCTCDLFENFNRADCSGQRLITPNVEVPTAVELLDLSYNDVTTLDNACFEGLVHVVNLTIAHNALHTIYLDAFSPLTGVESIDLSYNRLEYFDERIFETNTKLTRLHLSGNKFMSLQNKPLLKSLSIQYLGLHDAQVTYIYLLTFAAMPNLRELDISNNIMITLILAAFNTLEQLERLNLEGNRWLCDKNFKSALQDFRKRHVDVEQNSCVFSDENIGHVMFERMMEAPPSQTTRKSMESITNENVWKPKTQIEFEFDKGRTCEQQSLTKVCQLHRECLANIRVLAKNKVTEEILPRQYTANDLYFIFLTGISMGIAMVLCIVMCGLCIKHWCAMQKKVSPRRDNGERVLNIPLSHRPIPPPIPARQNRSNRRSRSRTRHTPPSLNRSLSSPTQRAHTNQSDFATFVSRFFERPSRHQYYRTINENTAHMIRRLSQSNLFNNRLSQHFTGGRSENGQQSEPLINSQAADRHSTSNQAQVHRSPEERWQLVRASATAPAVRPETPPPSYRDVVKPKWIA